MARNELASAVFDTTELGQENAVFSTVPTSVTEIEADVEKIATSTSVDISLTISDPQPPEMVADKHHRNKGRRGRFPGSNRRKNMERSNAHVNIVSSTEHVFHT